MKPAYFGRWRAGLALAGVAAALAPSGLRAAEPGWKFQSGPGRTALVELYTSEGCSSCPPAEAWMNRLAGSPGLWTGFVPVAFHVNYWDHLGWRDPWAAREFTERQRTYARIWKSDTIYTPGMVLNGSEWRAWGRDAGVPTRAETAGVLSAQSGDGRRWRIVFVPTVPPAAQRNVEAAVALLARDLESDVRAGENRGRRLKHDFVAIGFATAPMRADGDRFTAEIALPAERVPGGGARALAVWVAPAGGYAPLQALGGDLPARRP